jgi:2-keto-4-pentenoate hydratase
MPTTPLVPDSDVTTLADALWEAQRTCTPIAPIRSRLSPGDVVTAYAIQERNIARAQAELGWRVTGRKIGLTSAAVQGQLGVEQPDYGALFAELTYGDGDIVPLHGLLQPRIEAELALVLKTDIDLPHPTVSDVVRATDFALPAMEIVDSRIAGWDIGLSDTIADNASHGAAVLGTRPVPLDRFDPRTVTMSMAIDGEVVSTGRGEDCLGNPLLAATWLARKMVEVGTPLRAGDVVMTGALGRMHPVVGGTGVDADLGPLGSVTVSFGGDA